MPCCGQNREALRDSSRASASEARPPVMLEFTGAARIKVLGPISLHTYTFSPDQRVQGVAAADVRAILRTGLFRIPART